MANQNVLHFQNLTTCHRALYTMTLLILGVAYLFAMIQTFSAHAGRDNSPGLSATDLKLAYSGSKENTRLEATIKGPMSAMLQQEDTEEIVLWIQNGATEEGYQDKVI